MDFSGGPVRPRRDRVAVIIGSTRPTRICPGIAEWTLRTLSEHSELPYELIDLAEIALPGPTRVPSRRVSGVLRLGEKRWGSGTPRAKAAAPARATASARRSSRGPRARARRIPADGPKLGSGVERS